MVGATSGNLNIKQECWEKEQEETKKRTKMDIKSKASNRNLKNEVEINKLKFQKCLKICLK